MKPKVVLATDSLDPSGLGEHMLTLGQVLQPHVAVFVAFPENPTGVALTARAARLGLGIKPIDLEALDSFESWLRHIGADLLHVHAGIGWEGHGLTRTGRAAGVPVVRTEHLPYLLTDVDQVAEYRAEVQLLQAVIAVSDASRQSYVALDGFPAVHGIRNGVLAPEPLRSRAATRHELGLGDDDRAILTVARLTEQKNHKCLIAALPAVLAAHPSARLLLVGDGPEQDNIEAAIADANLADRVRLLGTRTDVPDLLAAADVFVLPSDFEGLPLVLLEAMASGLPIVATAIGGNEEALGAEYGFLVAPGDSEALAEKIIDVLGDGAAAASAATSLRQRFDAEFTADRMGRETEDVYAPFLAQRETRVDKTRIGFIGVGGIAGRHLGVLEQFDDVALVAFADPDFGRAQGAAERFGAQAYASHAEMLDKAELDAVYICIPPFAHGDAERAVIAKKLPFFVEKPLSTDIALADALANEIDQAGLVTAVGYHWRYLDTVDEAKRILDGNPARLISGYWLDQTPPPQWWWKENMSGGQMVEQTTHILDLARYLVGDVKRVFGLAGHTERGDFPGLDVPTVSTASLEFASGAVGNIGSTCLLRWGHRVGLHIFGDGLAIELTDHDIMVDTGNGRPYRGAEGDPVWREDRDFVDAVRGGENRIRSPYREALESHRVALAISDSARSGQPVSLTKAA